VTCSGRGRGRCRRHRHPPSASDFHCPDAQVKGALLNINNTFWVHEGALIRHQIGATRFNLKGFVDDVVWASGERDGDEYSIVIVMEQHGGSQQIQEASGNVVKARPR
jgi:hypothetical protein